MDSILFKFLLRRRRTVLWRCNLKKLKNICVFCMIEYICICIIHPAWEYRFSGILPTVFDCLSQCYRTGYNNFSPCRKRRGWFKHVFAWWLCLKWFNGGIIWSILNILDFIILATLRSVESFVCSCLFVWVIIVLGMGFSKRRLGLYIFDPIFCRRTAQYCHAFLYFSSSLHMKII